jgi:CHASE2 domain-containing sensor protein
MVSPHLRRVPWLAAIAIAAAALATIAWRTGTLNAPERAALDARFAIRGTESPGRGIAVVAVDEYSLLHLGAWPLPRQMYARLIELLRSDKAQLIVFDIAFDTDRAGDTTLLKAARGARPVVFAAGLISPSGQTYGLVARVARAHTGSPFLQADSDGVLRHMVAAYHHVPSLAVLAAQRTHIAARGALIDYAGPANTFATIPLYDLLEGAVAASRLAGRTVVIGATAPILQDVHATPFGQMAGSEIEANEIRTITRGVPLRPASDAVTALLIVLLAALPAVATALGAPLRLAAALSGAAFVVILVSAQLSFDAGAVLNLFGPLSALVLATAGTLTFGSIDADRERRRLREQFAAFAPQVVEAVLADPQAPLAPTAVIGGYKVEALLGRGGMAAVYRATQLALQRPVALKLIAPAVANEPAYRERFLRESRLAAIVEHPNVIPIYEAGDDAGLLFIAMRYVDGVDLEAVLQRLGALEPADAVRVATQLAGAVDAAHAHGLVHRDVKPANVLLDVELEHAYLVDFGIAGEAGASGELTLEGGFLGTPAYAPPEQARGEELDGRADIYALGGLLFHALTGQRPYVRGGAVQLIAAHMTAPVPIPSAVDPALTPFDPVIARAMAKRREERFATARELAAQARLAYERSAARPSSTAR